MSLPYWPNKGMSSTENLASYMAPDTNTYACPNVTVKLTLIQCNIIFMYISPATCTVSVNTNLM